MKRILRTRTHSNITTIKALVLFQVFLIFAYGRMIAKSPLIFLYESSSPIFEHVNKTVTLYDENICDRYCDGVNIHNYDQIDVQTCRSIERACQIHSCSAAIDIVVLWVNITDPTLARLFKSTYTFIRMAQRKLLEATLKTKPGKINGSWHDVKPNLKYFRIDAVAMRKSLADDRSHDENQMKALLELRKDIIVSMTPRGISSYSPSRFRDLNQLKYLFRSIEVNGKQWARRIFLVTNNQIPKYLNISHPRIKLVYHHQLFQYAKVTPPKYSLFNSIAIQSLVHSIPTLSSPFYLFDDDILIRKNLPINEVIDGNKSRVDLNTDMFNIRRKKSTIYEGHLQAAIEMALKIRKSSDLLGSNDMYFVGSHGPVLLYKEVGIKIWHSFREEMNLLLYHPFRTHTDPSIQMLHIYMGYSDYYSFVKNRTMLIFEILSESNLAKLQKRLKSVLDNDTAYFVCINDNLRSLSNKITATIDAAYRSIFPNRSSFECSTCL